MKNNWKTSVNEIITIFKSTLIAIIPWLEKAKIKWKYDEAYDDWDNICDSLYKNIVCSSLTGEIVTKYSIPDYGIELMDYSQVDFVIIKNPHNKILAFVSFVSISNPLDKIKVAALSDSYQTMKHLIIEGNNLNFGFFLHKKREIIYDIEVSV